MTLSAAVSVPVYFFLPLVQMSCAGLKDSESGLDLAREDGCAQWIIPLLMLLIILPSLARALKQRGSVFALASAAGGLASAYLMDKEGAGRASCTGVPLQGLFAHQQSFRLNAPA
jgi:hypothetical protein